MGVGGVLPMAKNGAYADVREIGRNNESRLDTCNSGRSLPYRII